MGCTRTIDLVGNSYLTDAQWDRVKSYLPEPAPQPLGGRPPHSNRACLEGILFVLLTGCQWEKLPKCFPSPSTCWRRFDEWTRNGFFEGLWFLLLDELDEQGKIDWSEAAADAWFARAKKGVTAWETPNAAKAPKSSTSSIRTARRSRCISIPPTAAK